MENRVLRYFLTVVQEESISAAAHILHITQPTLSRQLKELEEEVGKTLFERGRRNRKITLTEDGRLLRKRAEEILELVDKTKAELLVNDDIISGDIHIGGGETYVMEWIARTAHLLQQNHPHIRYHLYSGNAEDVTERLDKGLLDFGVVIQPIGLRRYDSLSLPDKDQWGVLMRKDNPLSSKSCIRAADLWDEPIISSRQHPVKDHLAEWMQKEQGELHIVATYNLLYNASLLVREGIGSALCLDKLINTAGDSELCFRPLSPTLDVGLRMIWKKYQVFSKPANLFLKTLSTVIAQNT